LHTKSVCHGDLKSVNILIEQDSLVPKLADFGTAAMMAEKST